MSELVEKLCNGEHSVEVSLRPKQTVQALSERLDLGHVHIKFTETKGGTELGVPLDREHTDTSKADFERETGHVTISGKLTLDYVNVRCLAEIELPSLKGVGRLERLDGGDDASFERNNEKRG